VVHGEKNDYKQSDFQEKTECEPLETVSLVDFFFFVLTGSTLTVELLLIG